MRERESASEMRNENEREAKIASRELRGKGECVHKIWCETREAEIKE